jgi:peptide/nickel transport system ATP-binding protein
MKSAIRAAGPPGLAGNGDLLVVRHLEVRFRARRGGACLRAVDGVNLRLGRGETLGLVGESGSGKSTTARAILRVFRPPSGEVWFDRGNGAGPEWVDLARLEGEPLRQVRRRIQMVFQDPSASLDPRQSAGEIIAEPMRIFRSAPAREIRARVERLLAEVGLEPGAVDRLPHEFSGGQRQRIGIARALSLEPKVLVLDEPVSALDVSIQAQVMNLLMDQKERRGLSYLFISHDLSLVRRISERVAVMYLGRIVEEGSVADVFERPAHPYTEALLSAVPVPDPVREKSRRRILLTGEPPSPVGRPAGCAFAGRCPKVIDACRRHDPHLQPLGDHPGHRVACLLHHPPA